MGRSQSLSQGEREFQGEREGQGEKDKERGERRVANMEVAISRSVWVSEIPTAL